MCGEITGSATGVAAACYRRTTAVSARCSSFEALGEGPETRLDEPPLLLFCGFQCYRTDSIVFGHNGQKNKPCCTAAAVILRWIKT